MEASQKWFEENGFTLDAVLNHQEIIPFVKTYLFKRNLFTLSYLIFNLIFLVLLLATLLIQTIYNSLSLSEAFLWFAYGCSLTFALIPFHEAIHGVAYKYCGAPKVSFSANWKKLYFMAIADKFVATRKPFYLIGLSPFIIISALFLLLAFIGTGGQQIMFFTVLFFHASMCAGDFGLMSYFIEQQDKEVATYDDAKNELTYFYIK
ncbi:MAG TPA: DUF3267 domain-containing protein [Bacteroidia bacterium]|nr:DUF3267 domain-containing protein [Bacteroidia bacterium]